MQSADKNQIKTRKPRTTKPKTTEATAITPPPPKPKAPKDIIIKPNTKAPKDIIIKPNTKINNLKEAQDIFKIQKKKEQDNIRQELREHAKLTKGAAILNRSLAKLEAKQNKNKTI
jgi:hypothetical protein